jgi:peptidylprolyl isomerase
MKPIVALLLLASPALADVSSPTPAIGSPPSGARRTASGLVTLLLKKGTGTTHPSKRSTVLLHYTGFTTDGKVFDSSLKRGQPASFPITAVIPGFAEGVELMVVGEKRRMWIPPELAYKNRPGTPQGTLVFDVELITITDT